MKEYGSEKNRDYKFVLVANEDFSKYGWTTALKNENSETMEDSFEKILIKSKRKPKSIITDRGNEFYNNILQNFQHVKTMLKFIQVIHL